MLENVGSGPNDAASEIACCLYRSRMDDGKLLVIAPHSDVEQETIALTVWLRIDKFATSEYSPERVKEFIQAHERRFNSEHF